MLFAVTPFGHRVGEAFDLGNGTTRGRFDDWAVGARMVERHPVLGVGPEGYRVVFPQVVSAGYVRRNGTAVIPDRAHNGVLDVAADGGVVAGLLYAALLALLSVSRGASLRSRDVRNVALACAVIAYVVQQQFLFPLSEVDPLFWVVAGMLVAATGALETGGGDGRHRAGGPSRARDRRGDGRVRRRDGRARDRGRPPARTRRERVRPHRPARRRSCNPSPSRFDPDVVRRGAYRGAGSGDHRRGRGRRPGRARARPFAARSALRGLDAELLVERAVRSGLDDDRARARTVVAADLVDAPDDPQLWLDRAEIARLDGDAATEAGARARAAALQPGQKS